ncbi:MAG: glycosyltransferase family 39 protein [Campylobacteraceae bacterium]|nr:glycosyltransferase family 39 protein [Campylobacteraceae bacterium]
MKRIATNEMLWIFIILSINLCFIFYSLSELSISYHESMIFFDMQTPLHFMVRFFCSLFGQNDWALRMPFVFLHVINSILVYLISKPSLHNSIDRIMCLCVYVMLPGVNASALIINEASLVIFASLSFIWLWQNMHYKCAYFILIISLGLDNSFSILYITLFCYGLFFKDKALWIICFTLFCASMYIYGFDAHGKPRGYFLDTIAVYAATLSPLVLLYYIYTLYRIFIKESKDILWFVCFGAFIVCILFSFRQRLYLEDFLPFAVIGVPLIVRVFLNSYRVRLPIHRRLHKMFLGLVIGSLFVNFIFLHVNKILYLFYDNPQKHFAYKHQIAKELADYLHVRNINALKVSDMKLAKRLKFYGIIHSDRMYLKQVDLKDNSKDLFEFDFMSKPIARYKVSSIGNNL